MELDISRTSNEIFIAGVGKTVNIFLIPYRTKPRVYCQKPHILRPFQGKSDNSRYYQLKQILQRSYLIAQRLKNQMEM